MPRRRTRAAARNASNAPDLALPKPERRDVRKLREEVEHSVAREAVRAQVYGEDAGLCRRCEWLARRGQLRPPRRLLLHTDNPARLAHVHEALIFRSEGGRAGRAAALDPRNLLTVCWQCHPVLQENREDVVPLDARLGCRGAVEFRPHERGRRRQVARAVIGRPTCALCSDDSGPLARSADGRLWLCSDCIGRVNGNEELGQILNESMLEDANREPPF